jgi:hypothetical protein
MKKVYKILSVTSLVLVVGWASVASSGNEEDMEERLPAGAGGRPTRPVIPGKGGMKGLGGSSGFAGQGGFSGAGNSGEAGLAGAGQSGFNGQSGNESSGSGGASQHPCVPEGDPPTITSADQLCEVVKDASNCVGLDPSQWFCYCEAKEIQFGCNSCLIAFPKAELTLNQLSLFAQVIGAGHAEFVRCAEMSDYICEQPANRNWAIVVGTSVNACMNN